VKEVVNRICPLLTSNIIGGIQVYKPCNTVASTTGTTLIGRISDIVRSGRGPDFVA